MKKLLIFTLLLCFSSGFIVQAMDKQLSTRSSRIRKPQQKTQVDLSALSDSQKIDYLLGMMQRMEDQVNANHNLLMRLTGLESNLWKECKSFEKKVDVRLEKIDRRLQNLEESSEGRLRLWKQPIDLTQSDDDH